MKCAISSITLIQTNNSFLRRKWDSNSFPLVVFLFLFLSLTFSLPFYLCVRDV